MSEKKHNIISTGHVRAFWPGIGALKKQWKEEPESEAIRKEWDRVFGKNNKEPSGYSRRSYGKNIFTDLPWWAFLRRRKGLKSRKAMLEESMERIDGGD